MTPEIYHVFVTIIKKQHEILERIKKLEEWASLNETKQNERNIFYQNEE